MTLDDRSLREHLDRRAETGVTDVEQLAEVVLTRVAQVDRGPWWRRLAVRSPSLGVAAAAVAVLVVALAVLPPRIWPGSGSSPTPTGSGAAPSPTIAPTGNEYPAERPLTADELRTLLVGDPAQLAGAIVVADVELREATVSCVRLALCPTYAIDASDPTDPVYVLDPRNEGSPGPGTYAFGVVGGTDNPGSPQQLSIIARVRSGPGTLTWSLGAYLEQLPTLLATDRLTSEAYLVEATAITSAPVPCPSFDAPPATIDFGCGRAAWLVPPDAVIPAGGFIDEPPGGLRIQNDALAWPADGSGVTAFYLVRPLAIDGCFMCPANATSQLLGTVDAIDLPDARPTTAASPTSPATPTPTPVETAGDVAVENLHFSTDFFTLHGLETADLTVTVTLAGDVAPYRGPDASLTPLLYIERDAGDTGDPQDPHIAQLVRTMTETPVAGLWTATFRLTAGDRGIWRVGGLVAYDIAGRELNVGSEIVDASPSLEVKGTSGPRLTMELKPFPAEVGQSLEVFGRVTDEDTGEPLPDVVVAIASGGACQPGGTGTTVTTNPNGGYTFVIAEATYAPVCAWISGEPGTYPSFDSDAPIALYAALFADPTGP